MHRIHDCVEAGVFAEIGRHNRIGQLLASAPNEFLSSSCHRKLGLDREYGEALEEAGQELHVVVAVRSSRNASGCQLVDVDGDTADMAAEGWKFESLDILGNAGI